MYRIGGGGGGGVAVAVVDAGAGGVLLVLVLLPLLLLIHVLDNFILLRLGAGVTTEIQHDLFLNRFTCCV